MTGFADIPNVRQAHTTTEKNVRDDIAEFKRQAMGIVQVPFNSALQKPV